MSASGTRNTQTHPTTTPENDEDIDQIFDAEDGTGSIDDDPPTTRSRPYKEPNLKRIHPPKKVYRPVQGCKRCANEFLTVKYHCYVSGRGKQRCLKCQNDQGRCSFLHHPVDTIPRPLGESDLETIGLSKERSSIRKRDTRENREQDVGTSTRTVRSYINREKKGKPANRSIARASDSRHQGEDESDKDLVWETVNALKEDKRKTRKALHGLLEQYNEIEERIAALERAQGN